jgi:hypothetical protein
MDISTLIQTHVLGCEFSALFLCFGAKLVLCFDIVEANQAKNFSLV